MPNNRDLARIQILIVLTGANLAGLLVGALLVLEHHTLWPMLMLLGLILFGINLLGFRKLGRVQNTVKVFPAVYAVALLWLLCWTFAEFHWWKCISVVVAILLLIASLKKQRSGRA